MCYFPGRDCYEGWRQTGYDRWGGLLPFPSLPFFLAFNSLYIHERPIFGIALTRIGYVDFVFRISLTIYRHLFTNYIVLCFLGGFSLVPHLNWCRSRWRTPFLLTCVTVPELWHSYQSQAPGWALDPEIDWVCDVGLRGYELRNHR